MVEVGKWPGQMRDFRYSIRLFKRQCNVEKPVSNQDEQRFGWEIFQVHKIWWTELGEYKILRNNHKIKLVGLAGGLYVGDKERKWLRMTPVSGWSNKWIMLQLINTGNIRRKSGFGEEGNSNPLWLCCICTCWVRHLNGLNWKVVKYVRQRSGESTKPDYKETGYSSSWNQQNERNLIQGK